MPVRVLVFEWFYGGGGWNFHPSPDPYDLVNTDFFRQGREMLAAVTDDLVRLGHHVTLLEDARLNQHSASIRLSNVARTPVPNYQAVKSTLVHQAAQADKFLLIAPETDGILLECCRWLNPLDTRDERSLNPNLFFVELTSNKQRTADWLESRGVPVPRGCLLSDGLDINSQRRIGQDENRRGQAFQCFSSEIESFDDFRHIQFRESNSQKIESRPRGQDLELQLPVIVKPIDGAGSDDVICCRNWKQLQRIMQHQNASRFRVEEFVRGISVSVSVIGNRQDYYVLPATEQIFGNPARYSFESPENGQFEIIGRGSYLKARFPVGDPKKFNARQQADFANRANRLAIQAVRALPETTGYFGIDMILNDEDSKFDSVIEINPRLTLSYKWLREIVTDNLAQKILKS